MRNAGMMPNKSTTAAPTAIPASSLLPSNVENPEAACEVVAFFDLLLLLEVDMIFRGFGSRNWPERR